MPRPPATAPRNPQATRQKLLAAAASLFASRGYDAVSTREVAARAGVNKAMISYHFGGKRGLYGAVLVDSIAAVRDGFAAIPGPECGAPERLRAFIEVLFRQMRRRPELLAILFREQMSGAPNLDAEVVEELASFFEQSREILEQGVAEGVFRPTDPHATHLTLVGGLLYFVATEPAREHYAARGLLPAPAPDPEHYAEHVLHLMLSGLLASPDS